MYNNVYMYINDVHLYDFCDVAHTRKNEMIWEYLFLFTLLLPLNILQFILHDQGLLNLK